MDNLDCTRFKLCAKCGAWKLSSSFGRHKQYADGLRTDCKTCHNARQKLLSADRYDPHQRHEKYLRLRTSESYKKRARQYMALWCRQHPLSAVKVHEYNARSYIKVGRDTRRRYLKTEKGMQLRLVASNNRRARKQYLPDTFTANDWNFCLAWWEGCCAYCGRQPGLWNRITADHFIPLSSPDCPGTTVGNIVACCKSCNSWKRNTDPTQWVLEIHGRRKGSRILQRIRQYFDEAQQTQNTP